MPQKEKGKKERHGSYSTDLKTLTSTKTFIPGRKAHFYLLFQLFWISVKPLKSSCHNNQITYFTSQKWKIEKEEKKKEKFKRISHTSFHVSAAPLSAQKCAHKQKNSTTTLNSTCTVRIVGTGCFKALTSGFLQTAAEVWGNCCWSAFGRQWTPENTVAFSPCSVRLLGWKLVRTLRA